MTDEGFLRRWARRKTEARSGIEPLPEAVAPVEDLPVPVVEAPAQLPSLAPADVPPPPTMDDVARLTSDSDFSAFVARGVDAAVRRTALKKLFADPHFNAMDGLDVYVDDYTKPSPVTATMLASLEHAKQVFHSAVDALDEGEGGGDEPAPPPEPDR
jgi:hypothetical protein